LEKPDSTKALVLGIDTGGTYTDGGLLDYAARRVLTTHKSLTTRRDFAIGIEEVIEGIQIEDPAQIKLVSISTTLATNAIAEGKGKRVALLLIGYDPELISTFNLEGRFATPYYYFFSGGHDLYGQEKEPLDLAGILDKVNEIKDQVDAIAISSYFSPLNPEHENRTHEAVSRICTLPIVLGHQLSTKLGSVERATTAALNASLLAVLQDFTVAVQRAMYRRQIDAPLMVVRGDGTLMSEEVAARMPVETIHSGPAASAIGGRFLSGLQDALIIDIGGTTTDLALIQRGQVTVTEEGAVVGGYKTSVRAADLYSIALGGDSQIVLNRDKTISIGPQRVMPLAHLAQRYAQVAGQLRNLTRRGGGGQFTPEWLEYWFLLREPQPELLETDQEQALVTVLQQGPRPLPEILQELGVWHVNQLDLRQLLRHEIIGKAGLTPTDLMHVEGHFALWDVDSANAAWQAFCQHQRRENGELRQQIWDQITEMIVLAILTFLSGWDLSLDGRPATSKRCTEIGDWFFYNSLYDLHPQLETGIRLRLPIIGIGAPAGIVLPATARVLGTELVLPPHHQVANAVGAVAGSVMITEELLVYPRLSQSGLEVLGYYVQTSDGREQFDELDQALGHARTLAQERALGAALRAGADTPRVMIEEQVDGLDTYRLRAKAMGNPRLGR